MDAGTSRTVSIGFARTAHERVYRVCCDLRLNLPRPTERRVPHRLRQPRVAPTELNGLWAIDFMRDTLYRGRLFRPLNVQGEASREGLAIQVGGLMLAARLVRVRDQLVEVYGRPAGTRCDDGPEVSAQVFLDWCEQHEVGPRHVQPGKPDQNVFIERFNRTYREEAVNARLFETVRDVQGFSDEWLQCNKERPHDALGKIHRRSFRRGYQRRKRLVTKCVREREAHGVG